MLVAIFHWAVVVTGLIVVCVYGNAVHNYGIRGASQSPIFQCTLFMLSPKVSRVLGGAPDKSSFLGRNESWIVWKAILGQRIA